MPAEPKARFLQNRSNFHQEVLLQDEQCPEGIFYWKVQ